MADKKTKKMASKAKSHAKVMADARRYVIKAGEYNGSSDSSDFMVAGHSTGSPYSEMEELSEQLTREVGGRPYRPVEFGENQIDAENEYEGEGLGDLGGPEFYGPKPSLLRKSPIHFVGESNRLLWAAVAGLAASAVVGAIAYAVYGTRSNDRSKRAAASGQSASTRKRAGRATKRTGGPSSSVSRARTSMAKSRSSMNH